MISLYKSDTEDFFENIIDENNFVAISKSPIEVANVRFRITLFLLIMN